MPSLHYAVFLLATFTAASSPALAGFAFGLIAAAIWLHILTPVETATLIVAFGLIVQGIAVWKLRHALDWRRLWPFLLGAGVRRPARRRHPAVGGCSAGADRRRRFLVLFAVYSLARPSLGPVRSRRRALDCGVGFLNGVLGGVTGLAGILVVMWCDACAAGRRMCSARCFSRSASRPSRSSRLWLGRRAERYRPDVIKLFLPRPAGAAGRNLARVEALRSARRGQLPPHRAGAAGAVRIAAGHSAFAIVRQSIRQSTAFPDAPSAR